VAPLARMPRFRRVATELVGEDVMSEFERDRG
jgi:hypothetical protein